MHSRVQQPCKFIGTKESVCVRKDLNSHRIGFVHQHGRQYGCHDVMCMCSISHFLVAFCLCLKTSLSAKSYENLLGLQVHFHANQTHLGMKSFKRRLVLKQRQKELENGLNLCSVQCYFLESVKKLEYNSCFQSLRVCCYGFFEAPLSTLNQLHQKTVTQDSGVKDI